MERTEVDILILGAGVTGLSLGSFLEGRDYLILEKEDSPGGYCKTTIQDGFVWDYSGHFFHFSDPEIKNYLLENYGSKKVSHLLQGKIHRLSIPRQCSSIRPN